MSKDVLIRVVVNIAALIHDGSGIKATAHAIGSCRRHANSPSSMPQTTRANAHAGRGNSRLACKRSFESPLNLPQRGFATSAPAHCEQGTDSQQSSHTSLLLYFLSSTPPNPESLKSLWQYLLAAVHAQDLFRPSRLSFTPLRASSRRTPCPMQRKSALPLPAPGGSPSTGISDCKLEGAPSV